jgi:hypothetical protein
VDRSLIPPHKLGERLPIALEYLAHDVGVTNTNIRNGRKGQVKA